MFTSEVRCACVVLLALIGARNTAADVPPNKDETQPPIETVVVSAHRLHVPLPNAFASISLDSAAIARTLTPSLADVLRQQAALDLTDAFGDGSQTTLSLRGFGGNASANTAFVIDGQPVNPADLSTPDLNAIALDDIAGIDILAGSSAVRYGDQAVGGVIALSTRPAGTGPSSVAAGLDSYDGRRYAVVVDGSIAGVGARLSGKRARRAGYRDGADFAKDDGLLHLSRVTPDGRLDLDLQRVTQQRLALGALSRAQLHTDRRQGGSRLAIHSRTDNGRFGWQQDIGRAHFEMTAYRAEFTSRSPSDSPTFGHSLTLIDRRQTSLSPRVLLDFAATKLLLGADARQDTFRFSNASSAFGDSGNHQRLSDVAAYAVLYQRLVTDVHLELGLRGARARNNATGFASFGRIAHRFDEHATAAEAALTWRARPALTVAVRTASSYRLPKADEQLSVFTGLNPLSTQMGRSDELTLNYHAAPITAMVNVYHLQLHREIDFDPRAGFFGDNINLRPTRRLGVLATAQWDVTDEWTAGANGHVLRARLAGGNTLPFVPRRSAMAWLSWQPRPWLDARIEGAYAGPRYAIGDYANAAGEQGGYSVVNLGLRARWRAVTLTLRTDNVFDRKYAELASFVGFTNALVFQPATGRRYALTLEYRQP